MSQRRVLFLGHDRAGQAVFQDLECPSDAPHSRILGTGLPTPTSDDVFRMTPAQAADHYGADYAARNPDRQAQYRSMFQGPIPAERERTWTDLHPRHEQTEGHKTERTDSQKFEVSR